MKNVCVYILLQTIQTAALYKEESSKREGRLDFLNNKIDFYCIYNAVLGL